MELVKEHFEAEAREFDQTIHRLIPNYEFMLDALVKAIPFSRAQSIQVIDLGCGTGSVGRKIKDAFPNAQLTCLDLAQNMLDMAKIKLRDCPEVRYQLSDFENYEFDQTFDVAVSSLALHHLVSRDQKIDFYTKIYAALKPGGFFYNADLVLASSADLQSRYMEQWRQHMRLQISAEEVEQKWIAKHLEEDHPAGLIEQLSWLTNIGFVEIDVIWKHYNFAVYGGRKV